MMIVFVIFEIVYEKCFDCSVSNSFLVTKLFSIRKGFVSLLVVTSQSRTLTPCQLHVVYRPYKERFCTL